MGHAPEEVGDLYSKLKDDVAFRQEWAERVALGFEDSCKQIHNYHAAFQDQHTSRRNGMC